MSFEDWQKKNQSQSGFASWQEENTAQAPEQPTFSPQYKAYDVVGFGPGQEQSEIRAAAERGVVEPQENPKDGFLSRVGKGLWNSVVALPAYAFKTKSEAGQLGKEAHALRALENDFRRRAFSGEPVTPKEIEWYASPTDKDGDPIKRPFWAETAWLNYQNGNLNIQERSREEESQRAKSALEVADFTQSQKADIFATISEAENLTEKATDVLTGITGFAARLALLKKAFPTAPPALLWELENEATGGTPGHGALTYALFNTPGKVIPGTTTTGKATQVASESTLLGGLTALESKIETGEVDWQQVAISAGIPLAFKSKSALIKRLKNRNPKVVEAAKTIVENQQTQPGALETLAEWTPKVKTLNKTERKAQLAKLRKEQKRGFLSEFKLAKQKGKSSWEAMREARFGFKRKAPAPQIEAPPLSDGQWNSLASKIEQAYPSDPFRMNRAHQALSKLRYGRLPQLNEWASLEPVLGTELLTQMFTKLTPQYEYGMWDIPRLTKDALKTPFGFDPQVLRQFSQIKERHPGIYLKSAWVNIRSYLDKDFAQHTMKDLESRPAYKIAKDKGVNLLGTKLWEKNNRLQQYGDFTDFLTRQKNPILKNYGRILAASERGANVGINYGLTKLTENADRYINNLKIRKGLTDKQVEAFWKSRAARINSLTKRTTLTSKQGKEIQNAANWVLFSPSYTMSRPASTWQGLISLFKGPVGDRTWAAQVIGMNVAQIATTSYILASLAHKERLQDPTKEPTFDSSADPTNSLFGKLRVGNDVVDMTGGDASWYRLIARVGVSAYAYAKSKQQGHPVTRVGGNTVRKPGEELQNYMRSRETVLLGLAKTMATGKDWLGNDISRIKALAKAIPPEALTSIVEGGMEDGLWEAMLEGDTKEIGHDTFSNLPLGMAGLFGYGAMTYPVPAVSTRSSFQNIVSNMKYKKPWDDLTPIEQSSLRRDFKEQFTELDKRVAIERVDRPVNQQRIQEEEKASGERVRSQLSGVNQKKIDGVSVNISRWPGDFYLNDSRFARYEELVVEGLNKSLSRFDSPNEALTDKLVSKAKKRAWIILQQEMRK